MRAKAASWRRWQILFVPLLAEDINKGLCSLPKGLLFTICAPLLKSQCEGEFLFTSCQHLAPPFGLISICLPDQPISLLILPVSSQGSNITTSKPLIIPLLLSAVILSALHGREANLHMTL